MRWLLLLVWMYLFLHTASSQSTRLYVAINSSPQEGPCTTVGNPCGSIQQALGFVNGGDVLIYVGSGSYNLDSPIRVSNMSATSISIQSTDDIIMPTFTCTTPGNGFEIESNVAITISRMVMINCQVGFTIKNSPLVALMYCASMGSSTGIRSSYSNITIERCTINGGTSVGIKAEHSIISIAESSITGSNMIGCSFANSTVTIGYTDISSNQNIGVALSRGSIAEIHHCTIAHNPLGLQFFDARNSTISYTNITDNWDIGGVYVYNPSERASLIFIHCDIRGNTATQDKSGGGVRLVSPSRLISATFMNCTIRDNRASFASGIYAQNVYLVLSSSEVSGNNAFLEGGGIYALDSSISISDSYISHNNALQGGGFYGTTSEVNITNTVISSNTASYGAGIFGGGSLFILESVISRNNASEQGGGAFLEVPAFFLKTNITGNRAGSGGGVYATASTVFDSCNVSNNFASLGGGFVFSLGSTEIRDSTVADNTALGLGGGILVLYQSLSVDNSIIQNNNAEEGGGIYMHQGELNLTNSDVALNDGNVGSQLFFMQTSVVSINNTINSPSSNAIVSIHSKLRSVSSSLLNTTLDGVAMKNLYCSPEPDFTKPLYICNYDCQIPEYQWGNACNCEDAPGNTEECTHCDPPDYSICTGIIVMTNGSDESVNCTYEEPCATIQYAVAVAVKQGGKPAIFVGPGIYYIEDRIFIPPQLDFIRIRAYDPFNPPTVDGTESSSTECIEFQSMKSAYLEYINFQYCGAAIRIDYSTAIVRGCKASYSYTGVRTYHSTVKILNSVIGYNDNSGLEINTSEAYIYNCTIVQNGVQLEGGGLRLVDSNVSIHFSLISQNFATYGGGIGIFGTLGNYTFFATNISFNIASQLGGGIYTEGDGYVSLTECDILGNSAGNGGAILQSQVMIDFYLQSCTIRENHASGVGGALFLSASTWIINTTILDNQSGGVGGGIYAIPPSSVSITQQTSIIGNYATRGGGIFGELGTTFDIHDSNFSANGALDGGGILNLGDLLVNESSFISNWASSRGGAIFSLGKPSLYSCTIMNNQADLGGGVYIEGTEGVIEDGIVQGNEAVSQGGGIFVVNCEAFDLKRSEIVANQAGINGGGVALENTNIRAEGATFLSNTAGDDNRTGEGGGVYMHFSQGNFLSCNFLSNGAWKMGGGMLVSNSTGNLLITSNFSSNWGDGGGGLALVNASYTSLYQCDFGNNSAGASGGGGIYIDLSTSISLDQCNFYSNWAPTGGAMLLNHSSSTITSSFFSLNLALPFESEERKREEPQDLGVGGAIFSVFSSLSMVNNSISTNEAILGGGVAASMSTLAIENCNISSNSAYSIGGGLYVEECNIQLSNNIFEQNGNSGITQVIQLPDDSNYSISNNVQDGKLLENLCCNTSSLSGEKVAICNFGCEELACHTPAICECEIGSVLHPDTCANCTQSFAARECFFDITTTTTTTTTTTSTTTTDTGTTSLTSLGETSSAASLSSSTTDGESSHTSSSTSSSVSPTSTTTGIEPFPTSSPRSPICGNGIIEEPEECDSSDLCCNQTTCELRGREVVCRPSRGECDYEDFCDGEHASCIDIVRSQSFVCRPSVTNCDIPEVCGISSSQCPEDITKLQDSCGVCGGDGTSCTSSAPVSCGEANCSYPRGICDNGLCVCSGNFSGPTCNTENVPLKPSPDANNPSLSLQTNTSGQTTSFNVIVRGIREITSTGLSITYISFGDNSLPFSENITANITTWRYDAEASNKASISLSFMIASVPTSLEFAGRTIDLTPSTLKFSVYIANWPFVSFSNRLQIVMDIESSEESCAGSNQRDESGNLRWFQINSERGSLVGKYLDYAIVDGETRPLRVEEEENEVTLTVPHFWSYAILDPDFSVIVDPLSGSCSRSDSDKIRIAAISSIATVLGIAAIVVTSYLVIRHRRYTSEHKKLQKKMDAM